MIARTETNHLVAAGGEAHTGLVAGATIAIDQVVEQRRPIEAYKPHLRRLSHTSSPGFNLISASALLLSAITIGHEIAQPLLSPSMASITSSSGTGFNVSVPVRSRSTCFEEFEGGRQDKETWPCLNVW